MMERVRGYKYMFVVTDRFSRWAEASPTKGPDAESAKTMKVALKILCIKQMFGCVYHPQSQGVVERGNGTLQAKLAKIKADSGGTLMGGYISRHLRNPELGVVPRLCRKGASRWTPARFDLSLVASSFLP